MLTQRTPGAFSSRQRLAQVPCRPPSAHASYPTQASARRSNPLYVKPASSCDKQSLRGRLVWCRAEGSEANRQLPERTLLQVTDSADGDGEAGQDGDSKTVRLPLKALAEEAGLRRTKLVSFTCNKCGGRSSRAVNPLAWEKGLVFGQCSHCKVWHVLSAKNPKIYEEIRFNDVDEASIVTP